MNTVGEEVTVIAFVANRVLYHYLLCCGYSITITRLCSFQSGINIMNKKKKKHELKGKERRNNKIGKKN